MNAAATSPQRSLEVHHPMERPKRAAATRMMLLALGNLAMLVLLLLLAEGGASLSLIHI